MSNEGGEGREGGGDRRERFDDDVPLDLTSKTQIVRHIPVTNLSIGNVLFEELSVSDEDEHEPINLTVDVPRQAASNSEPLLDGWVRPRRQLQKVRRQEFNDPTLTMRSRNLVKVQATSHCVTSSSATHEDQGGVDFGCDNGAVPPTQAGTEENDVYSLVTSPSTTNEGQGGVKCGCQTGAVPPTQAGTDQEIVSSPVTSPSTTYKSQGGVDCGFKNGAVPPTQAGTDDDDVSSPLATAQTSGYVADAQGKFVQEVPQRGGLLEEAPAVSANDDAVKSPPAPVSTAASCNVKNEGKEHSDGNKVVPGLRAIQEDVEVSLPVPIPVVALNKLAQVERKTSNEEKDVTGQDSSDESSFVHDYDTNVDLEVIASDAFEVQAEPLPLEVDLTRPTVDEEEILENPEILLESYNHNLSPRKFLIDEVPEKWWQPLDIPELFPGEEDELPLVQVANANVIVNPEYVGEFLHYQICSDTEFIGDAVLNSNNSTPPAMSTVIIKNRDDSKPNEQQQPLDEEQIKDCSTSSHSSYLLTNNQDQEHLIPRDLRSPNLVFTGANLLKNTSQDTTANLDRYCEIESKADLFNAKNRSENDKLMEKNQSTELLNSNKRKMRNAAEQNELDFKKQAYPTNDFLKLKLKRSKTGWIIPEGGRNLTVDFKIPKIPFPFPTTLSSSESGQSMEIETQTNEGVKMFVQEDAPQGQSFQVQTSSKTSLTEGHKNKKAVSKATKKSDFIGQSKVKDPTKRGKAFSKKTNLHAVSQNLADNGDKISPVADVPIALRLPIRQSSLKSRNCTIDAEQREEKKKLDDKFASHKLLIEGGGKLKNSLQRKSGQSGVIEASTSRVQQAARTQSDDVCKTSPEGDNGLVCKICQKTFSQAFNLNRHVNSFHKKPGDKVLRFLCKMCCRMFKRKEVVMPHCTRCPEAEKGEITEWMEVWVNLE